MMLRRYLLLLGFRPLLRGGSRNEAVEASLRTLLPLVKQYQKELIYGSRYYRIQREIEKAEAALGIPK